MKITFTLEGGTELMKNLGTLPLRVQKNVVRKAVRAAQKPMLTAARAAALALGSEHDADGVDMSELLARNIVITAPRRQINGSYSLHVQMRRGIEEFFDTAQGARTLVDFSYRGKHGTDLPRTKIGATIGVSYIPAAIEYGHMAGNTYVPPMPFLRPAADQTLNERISILENQLRIGILREAIKGR
jgi:hypothetical protein